MSYYSPEDAEWVPEFRAYSDDQVRAALRATDPFAPPSCGCHDKPGKMEKTDLVMRAGLVAVVGFFALSLLINRR